MVASTIDCYVAIVIVNTTLLLLSQTYWSLGILNAYIIQIVKLKSTSGAIKYILGL